MNESIRDDLADGPTLSRRRYRFFVFAAWAWFLARIAAVAIVWIWWPVLTFGQKAVLCIFAIFGPGLDVFRVPRSYRKYLAARASGDGTGVPERR